MQTGASFVVAAMHRFGSPAQEFHDSSIAEIQLIGKLQVGHGSKRNRCLQRTWFAGQAKSQVSAGRMADYDRRTANMFDRSLSSCHNVFERAWPIAARLTYPPILEIGRDNASYCQRRTERVGMAEIIFRPPESAMDENRETGSGLFGMPQLEKLVFFIAVGDAFWIHPAYCHQPGAECRFRYSQKNRGAHGLPICISFVKRTVSKSKLG